MLKMQCSFSPTWTLVLLIHLVWMSSTMVFRPVEAARSKVFESEYSSALTPRYEKSPQSEVATQIDESSVFSNVVSRVSIPTTVKYRPGF
ncbi:unnamed protein product [Sphagnum jensenii]|uniref:Uncharacterized protein n=1 Tax=Sphagnum jensenii TaxID=128206 RepID=A0ABP0WUR0_9BRYO